jgi:hypothetical protein
MLTYFGNLSVPRLRALVATLLADGVWDVVSWLTLAAPVVVCVRGLWRRH